MLRMILRLDTFELSEIRDDEILVKVVSDSICMSTYKCAILGTEHKRVHPDVAEHPAVMGHEFAGDIVKVGTKHQDKFKPGMKFTLQPALTTRRLLRRRRVARSVRLTPLITPRWVFITTKWVLKRAASWSSWQAPVRWA